MKRPERLVGAVLLAAAVLLLLFFLNEHLRLALDKEYSIDELQYAHGGWLISQGEVIYRDFFEHHHPLIHQLLALAFLVLDDDPNNVVYLRLLMLPFLLLTLVAAWRLTAGKDDEKRSAILAPLFVLMVPSYSMMATEVRPDPLAFALFLAAVAVLYTGRLAPGIRGFLSGVFLVAAFWGTLKVVYYGLVFPAALAADLVALSAWGDQGGKTLRRGKERYLLGHPFFFLAGAAAAVLPIAVYLTVTGSWGAWFEWSVEWSFVHQRHYPGFFWTRNFASLFAVSFWLFPLAVLGVVTTVKRLPRGVTTAGVTTPGEAAPDLLLLGTLATTLASFVWQSAAYLYSLVPFTVVWCVFAARGAVAVMRWLRSGRAGGASVYFAALLLLLFAVEVARARGGIEKLLARDNAKQHAVLRRLHQMTRPDEPVLNISGGQVTRPSVHFFYFFEAVVRQLKHDVFADEFPRSMMERGCIAYMPSDRFHRLPEPLRRFLLESFQPYDEDLWFWGRRWEVSGELAAEFLAVRDGSYFVWPPQAVARGELVVGEQRVATPVIQLAAGTYGVRYRGEERELYLVWLPADGRAFAPRPEVKAGLGGS